MGALIVKSIVLTPYHRPTHQQVIQRAFSEVLVYIDTSRLAIPTRAEGVFSGELIRGGQLIALSDRTMH